MPWTSYTSGQDAFEKITVGKTTIVELKNQGIDPDHTQNVAVLSQADLLHKLIAAPAFDVMHIAPELQPCLAKIGLCTAYEIVESVTKRQRIGSFWADFLNFKRETDVTGWQFDAIVVIKDNVVIYKLWSGKPNIHTIENQRNPLGPLQGMGSAL